MKRFALGSLLTAFALLVMGPLVAHAERESNSAKNAAGDPRDWPFWRGPEHNGVARATGLPEDWSDRGKGENIVWKREDLGSRTTPIAMNGKLYLITRADEGEPTEGERVVCVDAETGKTIWEQKFNVFLSDVPDTRVGWSNVVGDPSTGNVYALGVGGLFQCFDGETGKVLWSHSMSEEYGLLTTYGGRTNFPFVFDDVVIISGVLINWGDSAKPAHQFIAFNKETGVPVWLSSTRPLPYDTTYSSPILATIKGQPVIIFGAGDGAVYAMQPRTGKIIWKYQLSRRGVNATPLVVDDTVYIGHGEENIDDNTMGAIVAIDATGEGDVTKTHEKWRQKEVIAGKTAPIMADGKLWFLEDTGGIIMVDPKTGETLFRKKLGTMMRGSPIYADGKIYVNEANGRTYILKPKEDGFDILSRNRLRAEINGSPIVAYGKMYLPTSAGLYAIGNSESGTHSAAPPINTEAPVSEDSKPAQFRLVPAESLIKPGEKVAYDVEVFNSRGQSLGDPTGKVTYSVDGPGTVTEEGVYVAPSDAKHVAATVTAKLGDMEKTARVRVVPELPWNFDFSDNQVPISWIGARYRHQIRDVDSEKVMVKITTIPKGTRSQAWFGPSDLHDYTMTADVKGSITDDKMPDIGITAQRYVMELKGAHQQLQIRSWPTQLRMAETIPFEWKPDTWYSMKLRAENKGDDVLLRGKVWERGTPEPEKWTIEATDPSPNRTGSPGLYGNAKDAEIFLDNIRVTPNEAG
ncbi:Serine/threonine-protein kinase AfsK [Planctomycetes bacterium Pan216]|uniref:Serine/threonine-protein kinase AfsK n=1 Tax=Kolteria novifilia TaxID=2527975 RepID=A0A518BCL5_9BACT|nr:Serine/threonine-protein kinase AfsK [Planctomycetes bacterium Pan216]